METSSWMPRVEHPSQSTSTFGSGSAATVAAVSAAKIDGGECGPAVDDARLCLRNVGPDASDVEMTKESLAAVALLTEADAARHFNMGTTRFKSSCRALGIARWPHRKLMSLVKLYEDLCMHKSKAEKANLAQQARRVGGMMREIKAYAAKLEKDLSELNQFYNKRKAWPENILKIRQTVYKKRHAQVICNAKKNSSPPSRRTKRASGAARAPAAAAAVKAFVTAPEPIASETVDAAERMNEYDYGPIELLAGFTTRWDEMEVL